MATRSDIKRIAKQVSRKVTAQSERTVDSNVTSGSSNLISSGAVFTSLEASSNSIATKQDTLSFGISDTNVVKCGANIADDDFLRINGTTLEGRSASEMLSDIGGASIPRLDVANVFAAANSFKADVDIEGNQLIRHATNGERGLAELNLFNDGLTGSGGGIKLSANIVGAFSGANFQNKAVIETYKTGVGSDTPLIIKTIGVERMKFNHNGAITMNPMPSPSSDDRLKVNEKLIVNATETISKLRPQIYDKYQDMDLSGITFTESGLIAQEVYYNAPELRHLVSLGEEIDASGNKYTPIPDEMDLSNVDIANDPKYGSRGWSKTESSALSYMGLIPYLIKSNQEMHERIEALEAGE